jgi:hypothetical protein
VTPGAGRLARAGLVGLLAVGAWVGSTAGVVACSSEMPGFDHVVDHAATIVEGRVLRVEEVLSEPDDIVLAVDRVLKGESGPELRLDAPRSGLCGDGLDVPVGTRVIVATEVPFFDQVITPFWAEVDGGFYGTASIPVGAGSVDQLGASVAGRVASMHAPPVTDPIPPGADGVDLGVALPLVVAVAAIVGGLVVLVVVSRRTPGRRDDG